MKLGRGWHGDSKGHARAAKGEKTSDAGSTNRGWHGDSEGHAKAAKGETVKSKGFFGRFRSS